jgi:large subunit ribosomal protein L23
MLAKMNSGFRMWMPNMPMMLVSARNARDTHPASAVFRVLPRMTKHEIKEYLTKIYELPVRKVNTMIYLGKRKQAFGKRGIARWKERDYKKAIVTFDRSVQNVGLGTRIPELEDQEANDQQTITA